MVPRADGSLLPSTRGCNECPRRGPRSGDPAIRGPRRTRLGYRRRAPRRDRGRGLARGRFGDRVPARARGARRRRGRGRDSVWPERRGPEPARRRRRWRRHGRPDRVARSRRDAPRARCPPRHRARRRRRRPRLGWAPGSRPRRATVDGPCDSFRPNARRARPHERRARSSRRAEHRNPSLAGAGRGGCRSLGRAGR